MALYENPDRNLIFTYNLNKKQVEEEANFVRGVPCFVNRRGLYWIDRNVLYRYFNKTTFTIMTSDDFDGINRFIIVSDDTNILIDNRNFSIQHKGRIRFRDIIRDDFDYYPGKIIRNDNKLYNLYDFSNVISTSIPINCEYYIHYRSSNGCHNYITNDKKLYRSFYELDVNEIYKDIVSSNGLYYALINDKRAIEVDYDFSIDNIKNIEISGMYIMITFNDNALIYHLGSTYIVPLGSRLL